jgi:hypothetical protein
MIKALKAKTINKHIYKGEYIPASEAVIIAYKLATILKGDGDIEQLLTYGDNNLMVKILSFTTRNNEAINKENFDKIYTGNLSELMQALQFVVEENFGDFLQESGIGLLSTKAPKAMKEA